MNDNIHKEKTDVEIVEMIFTDPEAFGFLMDRYESRLLRYIIRLTFVSMEDAQDILQMTFLKVYRNLHAFDKKLKFSSWIYRITHNEAVSFLRQKKHHLSFDEIKDVFSLLDSTVNNVDGLEMDLVKTHLSDLPQRYADVVILKYFEEKDYREISDILKIPVGTVGTFLNRAKKALRKKIRIK